MKKSQLRELIKQFIKEEMKDFKFQKKSFKSIETQKFNPINEGESNFESKVKKIPNFKNLDRRTAEAFLSLAKQKGVNPKDIAVQDSGRNNGALVILVNGEDLGGRSFYSSKYDQMQYPQ